LGVLYGFGRLDNLDEEGNFGAVDLVPAFLVYFGVSFIVIFFNSALVACAFERLRGGSPNLRYGLRASYRRVGSILGWALFATTFGLVFDSLKRSDHIIAKIIGWVLSSIWAFTTFLVVPVLVIEGIAPVAAIKRSSQLLGDTWGNQVVANFGFTLAYVAVVVLAVIPIAIGAAIAPEAAIALGLLVSLPVAALGFAVLLAMDGIFKAALYQYATTGVAHNYFPTTVLSHAYVDKSDRGNWGSGGDGPDDRGLRAADVGRDTMYRSGGPPSF
jgi:hypothetical protein